MYKVLDERLKDKLRSSLFAYNRDSHLIAIASGESEMPGKRFLSLEQKKKLQKTLRESQCSHVRERVLIILLMNDGKTYQEISEFLGLAYRTVAYWAVHGDPDNLESFTDKRNQGNFKKVTDEYVNLLLAVIEKSPEELGYEFGRWTAARLANYLKQETGISLSGSQVRRILGKKNTFTSGLNIA